MYRGPKTMKQSLFLCSNADQAVNHCKKALIQGLRALLKHNVFQDSKTGWW